MLTIALVVLVIFLFLRKLWATVIPSVVAAAGRSSRRSRACMLLGYSIDNLSLMGLTIAVGFLVDDAIVMIENIVRYIEAGERPFEAAIKGAGADRFHHRFDHAVAVAVFIPLLFMSGMVGRLFHEFAMTVTLAICLSAFVVADPDADDVRALPRTRHGERRHASAAARAAASTA